MNLVFFSGVAAFFLTFSLFLQVGLGFTALHSGLTTVPFSVGSAVGSAVSVRLAPRLGRSILSVGCLLLVAGMAAVIGTIARYGEEIHSWQLLPALVVCGLGLGLTIPPLLNVILAGISGRNAGSASGVLSTTQQVGGALGVAIIGVIFFGLLSSQAQPTIAAVVPDLRGQLQAAHLPAPVAQQVVAGFSTCFQDRARSKDPSATPPSCRQASARLQGPAGQAIGQALQAIGVDARKRDFVASIKRTLWYEVAVYGLSFLAVFLLPKVGRERLREAGAAPA
jgi:MFS family permease